MARVIPPLSMMHNPVNLITFPLYYRTSNGHIGKVYEIATKHRFCLQKRVLGFDLQKDGDFVHRFSSGILRASKIKKSPHGTWIST